MIHVTAGLTGGVEHDSELAVMNDAALRGPVLVTIRPQAVALHQRR